MTETMEEKDRAMIKELNEIKSEFFANNFDKWITYLYYHNYYTYHGKLERIYKKVLKLKKEMDDNNNKSN